MASSILQITVPSQKRYSLHTAKFWVIRKQNLFFVFFGMMCLPVDYTMYQKQKGGCKTCNKSDENAQTHSVFQTAFDVTAGSEG